MSVPGKCQPKIYRFDNKLMNVKELAAYTGVPLSTMRGFVSKAQQDEAKLAALIAKRKKTVDDRAKKADKENVMYPCPDGVDRKVADLVKAYPHMSQWKLDHRMKYLDEVGIDKVFCHGKFDVHKPGEHGMDLSELKGMAPRKDITDIKHTGTLEDKYL